MCMEGCNGLHDHLKTCPLLGKIVDDVSPLAGKPMYFGSCLDLSVSQRRKGKK